MKSVIQTLAIVSSIALVILGVFAFLMPISEMLIKTMAMVGFIAAISMLVSVEWWRRDEEKYEERLKRKNQRVRLSTHI